MKIKYFDYFLNLRRYIFLVCSLYAFQLELLDLFVCLDSCLFSCHPQKGKSSAFGKVFWFVFILENKKICSNQSSCNAQEGHVTGIRQLIQVISNLYSFFNARIFLLVLKRPRGLEDCLGGASSVSTLIRKSLRGTAVFPPPVLGTEFIQSARSKFNTP